MSKKEKVEELLEKYLNHQFTPDEEKVIDQWYETISKSKVEESAESDEKFEARMWKTIQKKSHLQDEAPFRQPVLAEAKGRRYAQLQLGIAASITLLILVGLHTIVPFILPADTTAINQYVEKEPGTTIRNPDNNSVKPVRLEDGSLVILQPNSEIQFSNSFCSGQREVTLRGEAFFEITKVANQPFLVYTHGLVTKVLGTSFNIKANTGDKKIVVDVKTGKVMVYREYNKATTEKHLLTPNQQAVYDRVTNQISEQLHENPQIIISEVEVSEMKFEEAPASEVFEALEKAYGVDLVYNEVIFPECTLTTRLTSEGLYDKLKIICKALGATYETQETKVVIEGKGCE